MNTEITKKNLMEELKRISEAVKKFGGCWYNQYNEDEKPDKITDLVVCHNGCIGAAGYQSPSYSINSIYLDRKGKPIVSDWSCDGPLRGGDNPVIMLDKDKWMFPAFMIYNIESGDSILVNEKDMLDVYQRTLDDADNIAPVACINASKRIGGCYYGMTLDQKLAAIKKNLERS